MHGGYYILNDDNRPVQVGGVLEWARWMEEQRTHDWTRLYTRTRIAHPRGAWWVSTAYLGLDHRFWGDGPPILWETMLFSDRKDADDRRQWCDFQERYCTHAGAMLGHALVVRQVRWWLRRLRRNRGPIGPRLDEVLRYAGRHE